MDSCTFRYYEFANARAQYCLTIGKAGIGGFAGTFKLDLVANLGLRICSFEE